MLIGPVIDEILSFIAHPSRAPYRGTYVQTQLTTQLKLEVGGFDGPYLSE